MTHIAMENVYVTAKYVACETLDHYLSDTNDT